MCMYVRTQSCGNKKKERKKQNSELFFFLGGGGGMFQLRDWQRSGRGRRGRLAHSMGGVYLLHTHM